MTIDLARPAAAGRDLRMLVLGCLLYVGGSAIFYMMPAYLSLVGSRLSLDDGQLGALAGIESLAIAIASLAGPFWIGRINRRLCITAAVAVSVLGHIATAYAGSFTVLLAARFLVGLLGEGVLYTLSFTVLGAVRNVDRAFAIAVTAAVVFGAAIIWASAMLEAVFPAIGPLAPLIAIVVAIMPCLGWMAFVPGWQAPTGERRPLFQGGNRVAVLALAAQALWFGAPGAFWSFAEQLALDKNIPGGTAELALSIGEVVSLLGCLIAALLGDRWGRLKPIALAGTGMSVAAVLYQFSEGAAALCFFLAVFYCFWNYGTVYQMSFVAGLDASGRAAVVMPAAQVFGLSVGPFYAGRLMLAHGDWSVAFATTAFALAGTGLYLVCFSGLRRMNG